MNEIDMSAVVDLYVEAMRGDASPLYAARVVSEATGVTLAELHDALVERGLLKSYGA